MNIFHKRLDGSDWFWSSKMVKRKFVPHVSYRTYHTYNKCVSKRPYEYVRTKQIRVRFSQHKKGKPMALFSGDFGFLRWKNRSSWWNGPDCAKRDNDSAHFVQFCHIWNAHWKRDPSVSKHASEPDPRLRRAKPPREFGISSGGTSPEFSVQPPSQPKRNPVRKSANARIKSGLLLRNPEIRVILRVSKRSASAFPIITKREKPMALFSRNYNHFDDNM